MSSENELVKSKIFNATENINDYMPLENVASKNEDVQQEMFLKMTSTSQNERYKMTESFVASEPTLPCFVFKEGPDEKILFDMCFTDLKVQKDEYNMTKTQEKVVVEEVKIEKQELLTEIFYVKSEQEDVCEDTKQNYILPGQIDRSFDDNDEFKDLQVMTSLQVDNSNEKATHQIRCINCKMYFEELMQLEGHMKNCWQPSVGHYDDFDIKSNKRKTSIALNGNHLNFRNTRKKCIIATKKSTNPFVSTRNDTNTIEEKALTCKTSNIYLSPSSDLTNSKIIHNVKHPFTCIICYKIFSQSSTLASHMTVHSGEKPFVCDICNKGFTQTYDLTRHKRRHPGEKPFTCNICNKCYSNSSQLLIHNRKHTDEKQFTCNTCYKYFSRSNDLIQHIRVHTGERPFTCNTCNKSFPRAFQLTIHNRIHTGEKPFICNFCNKGFSHSSDLTKHNIIHSGDKPYTCNVCNKSFGRSSTLSQHRKIHTGVKPFSCEICSKCFSRPFLLTVHKREHIQ